MNFYINETNNIFKSIITYISNTMHYVSKIKSNEILEYKFKYSQYGKTKEKED
jgi:hypothetical protein